jgi:hypothetical protein
VGLVRGAALFELEAFEITASGRSGKVILLANEASPR